MLAVLLYILGFLLLSSFAVYEYFIRKRRFEYKVSHNNKVKELEERIEKLEKKKMIKCNIV